MASGKIKGYIVLLLFMALMGGGIAAIVYLVQSSGKYETSLIQNLFEPYFKAVSRQEFEKAWVDFTNPHYKQKKPLARFRQHYQTVLNEYGPVKELKVITAQETYEIGSKKSYVSVKLKIYFPKRFVLVRYRVKDKGEGVYKIEDSFLNTPIIRHVGPW